MNGNASFIYIESWIQNKYFFNWFIFRLKQEILKKLKQIFIPIPCPLYLS